MDVISMHQAGFNNAVASLGTALTAQQAALMKRYTDEVLVIYDSDEAGTKAALRAIPILNSAGLSTRVVNLKPHKDPDEFIQTEGKELFQERLDHAENSFLFEIRTMERQYDMQDPDGRTKFLHAAASKLVEIEDDVARGNYLAAVASKYGVEVQALKKLVANLALKGAGIREAPKPKSGANRTRERQSGVEKAQELMLTWITSYPELLPRVSEYISPEDFTTPLYRQVADIIFAQYKDGEVNPAKMLNHFTDSEEQRTVASLLHARIPLETEEEKHAALWDVICNMKESSIAARTAALSPTDMQGLMDLMQEKRKLEEMKRRRTL